MLKLTSFMLSPSLGCATDKVSVTVSVSLPLASTSTAVTGDGRGPGLRRTPSLTAIPDVANPIRTLPSMMLSVPCVGSGMVPHPLGKPDARGVSVKTTVSSSESASGLI